MGSSKHKKCSAGFSVRAKALLTKLLQSRYCCVKLTNVKYFSYTIAVIDKQLALLLYKNGHGYTEIGHKLGVSKQRIHQIIQNYKNYGRRHRKKKYRALENICQICRQTAIHLHHIDRNNTNDDIKNLLPVCLKCHNDLHRGEKRRPKLIEQLKLKLPKYSLKPRFAWSLSYKECINCLSIKNKHWARGLCVNCYMNKRYHANKKF